ncbi:myosin IC heavy chain-like [Suncus etruscus]|uniref:myosin IC heavy chain-like n=1 Tax=Suncus etruscus TaxID=109475 RepID=UPI00210FDC7D|nr:myosin IC heavy chain-like [Suncus etruscus]
MGAQGWPRSRVRGQERLLPGCRIYFFLQGGGSGAAACSCRGSSIGNLSCNLAPFSPRRAESGRWKEASERGPERAREREESERARGAEEGREGAGGGWREEMFRGEGSRGGGGHARSRLPGSTVAAPRSLEAHGSGRGTPRGSPRPATPGRASNRGAAPGGTWHPGPPIAEPGEALGWPEGRLGPCPPPRLCFSPWWRSGGGHGRGDTGRTAGPSPSRARTTAPRLPLGATGRALGVPGAGEGRAPVGTDSWQDPQQPPGDRTDLCSFMTSAAELSKPSWKLLFGKRLFMKGGCYCLEHPVNYMSQS